MAHRWVVDPAHPDPALIRQAAQMLCAGGLVAFPTETVYGLAADATNPAAIDRLNRTKGRPPDKPYSIHLSSAAQLKAFVTDVPPLAQRLIERFWPGPLTIVMPSGDDGIVGFRLPDHPVALALLQRCGRAIVAPSANRAGAAPPTDAAEVVTALGEEIDGILDAGPTPVGRESTVVSIVGSRLTVLREGAVSASTIEAAVNA